MKIIELSKNKIAFIDDEDFDFISSYRWYATNHGNARITPQWCASRTVHNGGNRYHISMHRQIMNAIEGQIIDHIDGNGLNNQKSNLRFCTSCQNSHNMRKTKKRTSSRYKGVSVCPHTGRWRVRIKNKGKSLWLGRYDTEEEAAIVYDNTAEILFGEFAGPKNIQ